MSCANRFATIMGHSTRRTVRVLIAAVLAVAAPAGHLLAQQKQHVSFKSSAENNRHTPEQKNIDVGDVPGHIVRIFEVHRVYADNAPVIDGLKLIEQWDRGIADLTDGNGSATVYGVYMMENGDAFFAQSTRVIKTVAGRLAASQVGHVTGGTGKFAGMHGTVRVVGVFDRKANLNEDQTDLEYLISQ